MLILPHDQDPPERRRCRSRAASRRSRREPGGRPPLSAACARAAHAPHRARRCVRRDAIADYTSESRLSVSRIGLTSPGALNGFPIASAALANTYSRAIDADPLIADVARRTGQSRPRGP